MKEPPVILVVDREAGTTAVIAQALRQSGYQVNEACNGLAALERLMGMILTAIAIEMLMTGIEEFLKA